MRSSPSALLDGLIAPAPPERRVAFLKSAAFAHRGLHGRGIVENSRAAFTAAIAGGHGIECDVQASRDGVVYVFHDDRLDRLTVEIGAIGGPPAAALDAMLLKGSKEVLPRFTDMLALVAGRAPLLIELKAPSGAVAPLCMAVRRALEGYGGVAAVMSLDPQVGRWFATHAPRIVRGLVVSELHRAGWRARLDRHLALWRARPDFLAWDIRDLPSRFAAAQRERGLPVLAWTVRDAAAERRALAYADQIIFERP